MLISWKQGASGDFATASNWNPAAVPGPGDDAIIGAKEPTLSQAPSMKL